MSKTMFLEMRPVWLRLADRTQGHAQVVMMAYMIVRELSFRWAHLDVTVREGLEELKSLCATEVWVEDRPRCNQIPEPRPSVKKLLTAAGVRMPEAIGCRGVRLATRKKLQERRKTAGN